MNQALYLLFNVQDICESIVVKIKDMMGETYNSPYLEAQFCREIREECKSTHVDQLIFQLTIVDVLEQM